MKHKGFSFINVISPCVTFNNNVGSTKSYDYVREHVEATSTIDFVPEIEEINANYEEGSLQQVKMHDGSQLNLQKLAKDWNPMDKRSAMNAVQNAKESGDILTGLIYLDENQVELHEILNTSDKPLNKMTEAELCPGNDVLQKINAGFR